MSRGVLTPEEVSAIRRFCDEGWTRRPGNKRAIARAYGVSPTHVYAIGQRLVWTALPEDADTAWGTLAIHPPATVQQVYCVRRFFDAAGPEGRRGQITAFARQIGLSPVTVSHIGRRQSYQSVPEEIP